MNSSSPGPSAPRPPVAQAPAEPAVPPLQLVMFVLRSARRYLWSSLFVTLVIGGLGCAVVSALPAVYDSTAKIFANPDAAVTVAIASGRPTDIGAQSTRGVQEAVLSRENLLGLVRDAELVDSWASTRNWALRIKDRLLGEPDRKYVERALVDLLGKSLFVLNEGTSSIRFRAEWRDAKTAARLAELMLSRFLSTRSAEEVAAIRRAIVVLEEQQQATDASIPVAMQEVLRVIEEKKKPAAVAKSDVEGEKPRLAGQTGRAPAAKTPAPELTEELQRIRQAQRELLEPWQRRKTDLKFQLAELSTQYGPQHPIRRRQEEMLEAASVTPPELAQLKEQEAELLASMSDVGAEAGSTHSRRGSQPAAAASGDTVSVLRRALDMDPESPEIAAARARLTAALEKSLGLSRRLDDARTQLSTIEASFKYRYSVLEPAEVATKPIKPNRPKLMAMVLVAALLLGLLSGAGRELLTGRIVEPWQVASLGIKVLGEVELQSPSRSRHPGPR